MKKIVREHFNLIFIGILIGILQMFTLTQVQFIKGNILDIAMQKNINLLPQIVFKLFVAILIMGIFGYLFSIVNNLFIESCSHSLRRLFFYSFLKCSYKEYFDLDEGKLITKYSKEISVIEQEYFSLVGTLVQMSLQIAFIVIALFYINALLAVLSFMIFTISYIRSYFPPEKVKKIIQQKNGFFAHFIASILGVLSPF